MKSFGPADVSAGGVNQERSILSKLFRGNGSGTDKEIEPKDNRSEKSKQHRISRFLRPDFFDTPREESQYVKEKEAQKAAENERRKSRFMRRKSESKDRKEDDSKDEKICKEQKNEINTLQKDKLGGAVVVASSSSSFASEDKTNKDKERVKIEQGSKSSFLHSLEKKLERLRSNDESTSMVAKPTINGSSMKERGLRECSAPPIECSLADSARSSLLEVKKTLSVENLSRHEGSNKDVKNVPSSKGRVTSVLGLFKTNTDTTKRNANGRTQNAIMSKLKRSPPKCVKSVESSLEEDVTGMSKIPTKFTRTDNKLTKKLPENKRSPEKVMSEMCKRSPSKEKSKEKELIVKERKPFVEKQSREVKRPAPSSDSSASSSVDRMKLDKVDSLKKSSDQSSELLRKVVDDKHIHVAPIINNEDKKLIKTKRNINSLVGKHESVTKIDKGEDVDKNKMKKLVKSKENANKDETNDSRKKKIVRVVKKVVKKSDSSESKSDEKGKSSKLLTKKKIVTTKKEKSPEGPNVMAESSIEGNDQTDDQITAKSSCMPVKQVESDLPAKSRDALKNANQIKTDIKGTDKFDVSVSSINVSQTNSILGNVSNSQSILSSLPPIGSSSSTSRVDSNFNICQSKQQPLEQCRPNRANLKLDLSKIPQHTFRHATPKRDSPECSSPKTKPIVSIGSPKIDDPVAESSDKLMERLSKMTHHANITGNKIIIDKPLRAKDVAELKREVTECARIIENHVESRDHSNQRTVDHTSASNEPKEIKLNPSEGINDVIKEVIKEPPDDCTSEMFSPEEPESFDSWSICSADLNHNRSDLHSPT